MSHLKTLFDRNRQFAANFEHGDLAILPRLSTAVLACLDARSDPAHFLGLEVGDAVVLRNTGGRVTANVERDIAVLWFLASRLAGGRSPELELAIIQHTDCGMERFANPHVRRGASQGIGVEESDLDTMAITDHETSLHGDIERLRRSDLVPGGLIVSGHLYDVNNGQLSQIVNSAPLTQGRTPPGIPHGGVVQEG